MPIPAIIAIVGKILGAVGAAKALKKKDKNKDKSMSASNLLGQANNFRNTQNSPPPESYSSNQTFGNFLDKKQKYGGR